MGGKSAANSSAKIAKQTRADELAKQERIKTGTSNINSTFDNQFNDEYYNKLKQSYLDYANPQLTSQYDDASKELTYALDRSGLLNSSSRSSKEADLQKQYNLQAQSVADKALGYQSTAQQSVEDARSSLISALNNTGDATQAANDAVSRATALNASNSSGAATTLSNLFSDYTNTLNTQTARNAAAAIASNYSGGGSSTGGTTLYKSNSSGVKVS